MTDEIEKPLEDAAPDDAGQVVFDDGLPTVGPVARVREFPQTPGVYLMKDSAGRVIYVGKAKNLRARAGSYFLKAAAEDRRTADLVREIADIDFIAAESEVDALLVEARLIKDVQPKFNQDLKDDKTFPYLEITTREDFPRVEFTRTPHERGTKLYGPFASAGSLRGAMQVLQKIFKFRTCTLDIDEQEEKWRWYRPCLLASIGQCSAPCNLRISKDDYRRDIHRLKMFLEGNKKRLLNEMKEEMRAASAVLQFERAARLRDEIHMLETLDERGELETHVQPEVFFVDPKKGLAGLQRVLKLDAPPRTIEGRGHRAPGRNRDRGQPGAVHRRAAVQAQLSALQDSRRAGRRRLCQYPRGDRAAISANARRRADLSRPVVDRRRQGAAFGRGRSVRRIRHRAAENAVAGQARGRSLFSGAG